MKRGTISFRPAPSLGLAAVALLLLAGAGLAGTPAAPQPAPVASAPSAAAAPEGAKPSGAPAARDIFDQPPYPAYEPNDRVDPFTRGKPKGLPPPPPPPPPPPGDETSKVLGKALKAYDDAEALLSTEGKERHTKCAEACHKGITDLKQVIADIGKEPALAKHLVPASALLERFGRLEATAKRLKQRQDLETEFAGLKVTVDGIVWNPQSATAVVNGQVASEGAVLRLGAAGQDAQLYRIRRDAVIFLYKGVQVSVRLNRGGL